MSFGGLLGSLYGDLPAPKTGVAEVSTSNLPKVPAPIPASPSEVKPDEPNEKEIESQSSPQPPKVDVKPTTSWVADRARLLLLQPVNRKREAAGRQSSSVQPAAKKLKEESNGSNAETIATSRVDLTPRQPLVPIANEYDPAKPNSYDDVMKERTRNARRREEEARRQEEFEQMREKQRMAAAAAAPLTSNLNLSGEEAWKRRGQITAAIFGEGTKIPGIPSQGNESKMDKTRFAQKMLEKMGWKHGEGLGKEKQGILAPLVARKTDKRSGVIVHGSQQPQKALSKSANQNVLPSDASRILLLTNLVGRGEVDEELEAETADEAMKYGNLLRVKIVEVESIPDDQCVRIFCEYDSNEGAFKALSNFNGRLFGGRCVKATFFDETLYAEGNLR